MAVMSWGWGVRPLAEVAALEFTLFFTRVFSCYYHEALTLFYCDIIDYQITVTT